MPFVYNYQSRMLVSFYSMTIPYNVHFNSTECPVEYNARKYGFSDFSPLPKSSHYDKNKFYICLPQIMAESFLETMKECEDCHYEFIRTQQVDLETLSDTHVREIIEMYNGEVVSRCIVLRED
jgi:hypothetical protein